MQIRRIVTGHDETGRAVFSSDERVLPVTLSLVPGAEYFELWSTDAPPVLPDDTGVPEVPRFFPPDGGSVLRIVTFPPRSVWAGDDRIAEVLAEVEATFPDMVSAFDPGDPELHRTDSLDYGIVLDGELELELDDGRRTTITPGTVVVQRGTTHAWRNLTERPAQMAYVLIGCPRR